MMFNIFLTLLFVCLVACDTENASIDVKKPCQIRKCGTRISPVCAVSEGVFDIFGNYCELRNRICSTGKEWEVIKANNCIIALCSDCIYRRDRQCVLCGMART